MCICDIALLSVHACRSMYTHKHIVVQPVLHACTHISGWEGATCVQCEGEEACRGDERIRNHHTRVHAVRVGVEIVYDEMKCGVECDVLMCDACVCDKRLMM
jgi:hypothetical protein